MGRALCPPCFLTWDQTRLEVMKIMMTSFKSSHIGSAACSAPNPAAGHHQPMPPPGTPGHSQASLGPCLLESLLLSPGSWCTRFCLCPTRVCFPVLWKFWQLFGRVNGDLLQEDLCHTQVCCTQSPCPHGSPLLTHISTEDTQTQFCLSLCGVTGSRWAQGHLSPLSLLASMGFDSKYDFSPPIIFLGLLLCLWKWVISSKSLQHHAATPGAFITCEITRVLGEICEEAEAETKPYIFSFTMWVKD